MRKELSSSLRLARPSATRGSCARDLCVLLRLAGRARRARRCCRTARARRARVDGEGLDVGVGRSPRRVVSLSCSRFRQLS